MTACSGDIYFPAETIDFVREINFPDYIFPHRFEGVCKKNNLPVLRIFEKTINEIPINTACIYFNKKIPLEKMEKLWLAGHL